MNWQQQILEWLPFVPAFLLAISVHESAHAWMALKRGDNTAAQRGRISLYPPRHIDFFGSIVLPILSKAALGFFYGYAKPTPVDPAKLRRPKADFSLVALAGPLANLGLALLSAVAGRMLLPWVAQARPLLVLLEASVELNLCLGVLNLCPLPGFDGMKALYVLLPDSWCWRLNRAERWGMIFLLLASALGALGWIMVLVGASLSLLGRVVGFPL
jgi:Zn-dependent protease